MDDESGNEMDSNHPIPSQQQQQQQHHHLDPILNESRKRPANYHPSLAMLDGLGQSTSIPPNFLSVHGTIATPPTATSAPLDGSSSPSPQSTYSPQSSPSESRTSPNTSAKQQQQSNKYSTSTTSTGSTHLDLSSNRLNCKLLFTINELVFLNFISFS